MNYGRFNLSVADSGFDSWLDGYKAGSPDRKVSIYADGALCMLMIDLEIINFSKFSLKSKGLLFFEINNKYYDDLNQYLVENGFKFQKFDDHRGLSRFILALKSKIHF